MYLYIDKPDTMQAEKVHIKAKNLIPHETYKIVLKLKHSYGTHMAYAVFKADASGEIDVPTAKPLRGTYDGISKIQHRCFSLNVL
uniref:Bile_Hydr_Trans domain-containing protein n=1 Tax=Heterorhabditis bacteriophora TaxID=37862 RepID=A0A1I7WL10_HETBA